MRRRWWVVVPVGVVLAIGGWVVTYRAGQVEGPVVSQRTPIPRAPVLPASPSLGALGDLGLDDAEGYDLHVLEQDADELLIVYPKDVDPVTTAARWSLALENAGLHKTDDWSRPGRTVLRFQGAHGSVLLAVGATIGGPFVLYARPATDGHWAMKPDEAAPQGLRPLLPPPPSPPAPAAG